MKGQIIIAVGCTLIVALPVVAQAGPAITGGPGSTILPTNNPGVVPMGGYANPYQTTTGFYNPSLGNINYPSFGAPVNTGGSFYRVPSGNTQLPMWRAPSGYYYPWCPRPSGFAYAYPMPVLIIENRQSTLPAPALPPISTVMTDMEKYLDDSKKDGKITERDHTNMLRRVKDLKSKERTMRIAAGGSLDPGDETQLRSDLDQVGSELTWRLNR
ncbi:MAG: hypothetical protein SGJ27_28595 [Candidatus Melainabacteria bacterium]|nr:hypothetical protein [Candidatus Melainabacteria bacterium]